MAVAAGVVAVAATAGGTLLVAPGGDGDDVRHALIYNGSDATVYVGPQGLTTANGFPVATMTHADIELRKGDALYAIVAAGPKNVNVLYTQA